MNNRVEAIWQRKKYETPKATIFEIRAIRVITTSTITGEGLETIMKPRMHR